MTLEQPVCMVQLTDCHLSADPAAEYRGINPVETLERLLARVAAWQPDAVVLSGDVSEDGSAESYQLAADRVAGLAETIAWLPGNHDHRETMAEAFKAAGFQAGPVLACGGWQIALLDSAWPDRPEGELDEARLAPLDQLMPDRPAMVFVHHQPISIGSPWIDKYPLVENQRLWRRLDADVVRIVAFGHVHQVFDGEHQGIACLGTPATSANSYSDVAKFSFDPFGPAARWFRLWPDGKWLTGIIQADAE